MATVVVTGSSGFIGEALVGHLTTRGDTVIRLVRREPAAPGEVRWDPASRRLDPSVLDGVDAVVNLAGAGIGDKRWTPAYRREIISSRVDATHAVATAVAEAGGTTRLVSGSAIGYYGNRGEEELTEDSPPGEGFTTEVVRAWEASTAPAAQAGASVAFARSGIVIGPGGGAMARMLPLARLGLGG
ncbi:NAD-dependent epimerase/dehydratase family protein, partial [Nostocoides japonicum]|uniref:NAD-dependent epimerase/dehydratase family protein n=1 Tax=Nostocoides japonicum TaxID=99481 RepID=UPI00065BC925